MALSSHAKAGSLIVMDSLVGRGQQDQDAARAISPSSASARRALVIDGDAVETSFALRRRQPARQINVLPAVGANVYDILKHDTLVLTRAAVEKLEARFNG